MKENLFYSFDSPQYCPFIAETLCDDYRVSFQTSKFEHHSRILDISNVYELSKEINSNTAIDYHNEVYAIIPVKYHNFEQAIVLYRNYYSLICKQSFAIIQSILQNFRMYDYELFKETLRVILEEKTAKNIYKIPCAVDKYSLFPLTQATDKQTIWINPGRIQNIEIVQSVTVIQLQNGCKIASPIEQRGIRSKMLTSFIVHGIIKRENSPSYQRSDLTLLEFLQLPSLQTVRKLIREYRYTDLPKQRGDFTKLYRDFYAENHVTI